MRDVHRRPGCTCTWAAGCSTAAVHDVSTTAFAAAAAACRMHILGLLLLLLVPSLVLQAAAQHKDPSPQIITTNLPRVCSSGSRPTQVQDVTDSTSYYVCCGGDTPVVRKTCQ
jgi:hypothetical protein